MRLFLSFLIFSFTMSCSAEPAGNKIKIAQNEIDCTDIQTSAQVDHCVKKEMEASNTLLSNTSLSLEKRIKLAYSANLKLGTELIEISRNAQTAWLTFRDQSCKINTFEVEEGTPAYITATNDCIIQMNTHRIDELNELLN